MTTDTVGGVWTFTRELAAGLLRKQCSIALVSLGRLPSEEQARWCSQMAERYGKHFEYHALDLPLEWMPDNARAYGDAEKALLRIAHTFRADLLHSNQFCFGKLPVRIPRYITAHSDVLSWAEHCDADALQETTWLHNYIAHVSEGLLGADRVIAPTACMLSALARNFFVPGRPAVIANGRSLPQPTSCERRLQAVTAGRLWDKGKAVRLLEQVEAPFPLLIAGEPACQGESKPDLHGVECLGTLPEEELLALFAQSAIYICTSIYEPFGLAPLEAGQCGCAVVARDLPALREVWDEGALYFSDARSLSMILRDLAENPIALQAAQISSTRRARQLSSKAMVEKYHKLFVSALRKPEVKAYVM